MTKRTTMMSILGYVALVLGVAACDGEGPGPDDGAAEACEHMQEGPAEEITAGLALDDAPDVSAPHTRYDLDLVAIEGGNGGSVSLAAEGGEYVVFLSADVPVAFFDGSGSSITPEQKEDVDACAEVAVAHHLELDVGAVELRFGATEATRVSLVIEAVGDEDAHDH